MDGRNSEMDNGVNRSVHIRKQNQFLEQQMKQKVDEKNTTHAHLQQKTQYSEHLNAIIDKAHNQHLRKTPITESSQQKYIKNNKSKRGPSLEKNQESIITTQNITTKILGDAKQSAPVLATNFGFEFAPGMASSFHHGQESMKMDTQ